jgi:hypothetical protein
MNITFTGAIPQEATVQRDTQGIFARDMAEAIHTATDGILGDIKGQTPYPSIASAYGSQDVIAGNTVTVTLTNSSPIWPFREYDTRPHWPPFGPGSSLANWSNARGIPPFLVARKISRFGTTGNHIVSNRMQSGQAEIQRAIQSGLVAFMYDTLGVPR